MDSYYLNLAVYGLEDFLKTTDAGAEFEYGRPMKVSRLDALDQRRAGEADGGPGSEKRPGPLSAHAEPVRAPDRILRYSAAICANAGFSAG